MLAIIGGSGLNSLQGFEVHRTLEMETPFGFPSAPLGFGRIGDRNFVFLPRHGVGHRLPPHLINYRANIWALWKAGAKTIMGVAAVGGISPRMRPTSLVVPDQIIDYTWGREPSFGTDPDGRVLHIDFTHPYCEALRQNILAAAEGLGIAAIDGGTYGAVQGPRLETAREIQRLERDGCDLVGMTGMPEAALARELGLCYACCALVANWAAGKEAAILSMTEIEQTLRLGMTQVLRLIPALLDQF